MKNYTGKINVSNNLKRRRTWIDKNGNVTDREGFDDNSFEEKRKKRAQKLGLPYKGNTKKDDA